MLVYMLSLLGYNYLIATYGIVGCNEVLTAVAK